MKEEIRQQVEAAFEAALAGLEDRERLVLRLYLVSGMTMERIGKTLGITHQAVSQQLVKARKRVLAAVRRELDQCLKVSKSDLRSVVRLVASELNLSISRVLGAAPAAAISKARLAGKK
jgi:RNA polymerase sigma-70 factor (ECF subfamily)